MIKLAVILASTLALTAGAVGYNQYTTADTELIRVNTFGNVLTRDGHATADVHITNNNTYAIKNIRIECVGAYDTTGPVEGYVFQYDTLIQAGSSKTFRNEYLGHYSNKAKHIICVEVASAKRA